MSGGLFHSASVRVDRRQFGAQSRPWRRLAAAANGPITKLTSDSAHRIENGVPNDSGPVMAACEAATPNISTGIDSGSTSTASNSPPRCSVTANAAPIMPVNVSAGVPASSVSATAAVDVASRFNNSPSTGVATTSGNPAASQCASALAAHVSSSCVRLITIRSDRERHQDHHGEKEQHADQRAATHAQRDLDVPPNQCGEGGHDGRPCFLLPPPLRGRVEEGTA